MKKNNLGSLFHAIFKQSPTCRILLYHRVADVKDDPHLLSVSVSNFTDQIAWLKENYNIIPLSKLIYNIKSHTLNSKSVCITFDDGYSDNFYNALPILKKFQVPATIFITTGMVGKKSPFYWDKNSNNYDQGRALTKIELNKLASEELIEIGSHTITHPRLSLKSVEIQQREIYQSKEILEKILKKHINGFSYPFGTGDDYNKSTIAYVKNAGYTYAVANYQNYVNHRSNIYSLPRFLVRNWHIDIFQHKISQI